MRWYFYDMGFNNLSPVLCDAVKSSVTSGALFGVLGRLYVVFAAYVTRWMILHDQVIFSAKHLSDTRWEVKFCGVKALRHQIVDDHDARSALTDTEERHDH
jgi:hypothetical protein